MSTEAGVAPADARAFLWGAEVARLALGLGVLATLARVLPPELLGSYLAVTSLALLAPRLLDAGLPHAMAYFLRMRPQHLEPAALAIARHVLVALPVAAGIAFGLRWFPFADPSVTQLVGAHWPQLTGLMVSELAVLLGLSCFVPTGRFRAYLATTVVPPAIFLLVLTAAPPGTMNAGRLLDLLLSTSLAGTGVMALVLARASRKGVGAGFSARAAYAYGVRSYGSAVAKIAAQRFDRLFLVTVLGGAGYAQYSLAISVRDLANFPANLYAMTLRNRQIDLIAKDADVAGARRLLIRSSAAWAAGGVAFAATMLPLWPTVVRLGFGHRFDGAAGFLDIVAFSCGPLAVMGLAWNHLYALGLPGRVTVLTCGSLLLALPLFRLGIVCLGPTTGVAAAVLAWSIVSAGASLGWALRSPASHPTPPHS